MNLTKALGIAGITALSFLPMNGKGQDTIQNSNGYEVYNKKGKLIEKLIEDKRESTKEIYKSDTIKYEYDEKEQLIKEVKRGWELHKMYGRISPDKKVNYVLRTDYKHNDKGQLIEVIFNNGNGDFRNCTTNYEYNEKGELIRRIAKGRDEKITDFIYNDKGQLIREASTEDYYKNGKIDNIHEFTYGYIDKEQFLMERKMMMGLDYGGFPVLMRSFFNKDGKKLEDRFQKDTDGDEEIDYLGISNFKYDCKGELIEVEVQIDEEGNGKIDYVLTLKNVNGNRNILEGQGTINGKICNFDNYFRPSGMQIYLDQKKVKLKKKLQKRLDDGELESLFSRIPQPWKEWFFD